MDRFVADDICVLAPPLIVRRKGDPVYRSIMDRLKDRERPVPDDLLEMDYISLSALGYRDFLHFADPAISETPEDDLTRNANTLSEPPTGLVTQPGDPARRCSEELTSLPG